MQVLTTHDGRLSFLGGAQEQREGQKEEEGANQ